jgi:hypothetical protein
MPVSRGGVGDIFSGIGFLLPLSQETLIGFLLRRGI